MSAVPAASTRNRQRVIWPGGAVGVSKTGIGLRRLGLADFCERSRILIAHFVNLTAHRVCLRAWIIVEQFPLGVATFDPSYNRVNPVAHSAHSAANQQEHGTVN